jgi:hypothetical protein
MTKQEAMDAIIKLYQEYKVDCQAWWQYSENSRNAAAKIAKAESVIGTTAAERKAAAEASPEAAATAAELLRQGKEEKATYDAAMTDGEHVLSGLKRMMDAYTAYIHNAPEE